MRSISQIVRRAARRSTSLSRVTLAALATPALMTGVMACQMATTAQARTPTGPVSRAEWKHWDEFKGEMGTQFHYWVDVVAPDWAGGCKSLRDAGSPQPSTGRFEEGAKVASSTLSAVAKDLLLMRTWGHGLAARARRYHSARYRRLVSQASTLIYGGAGLDASAFDDLAAAYKGLSELNCNQGGNLFGAAALYMGGFPDLVRGLFDLGMTVHR